MQLNLNGMEDFLKFFEVKHNFNDIIKFEDKVKGQDVVKYYSISKIPMLQLFFKIILEYYYRHEIILDYSDNSISDETKSRLIQKIESYQIIYQEKGVKMFNLVDFMFKNLRRVLEKSKKGFDLWKQGKPISFNQTIMYDIDLYFYILFFHVLPSDLKSILKRELHISDMEDNIINKCTGIIIKNDRICNLSQEDLKSPLSPYPSPTSPTPSPIDSISENEPIFKLKFSSSKKDKSNYSLNKAEGIGMLLKMFSMLRGFSQRRRSKML
jgi:hypothetical protein